MATSEAKWLDQQGRVRLVGQLEGDFGGLPTGWTQDDSDPANVDGGNGSLQFDDGTAVTALASDGLNVNDSAGGKVLATTSQLASSNTDGSSVVQAVPGANVAAARLAFFGATPAAQQTGVAVTAAAIHAALVNLGLITA